MSIHSISILERFERARKKSGSRSRRRLISSTVDVSVSNAVDESNRDALSLPVVVPRGGPTGKRTSEPAAKRRREENSERDFRAGIRLRSDVRVDRL